MQAQRNLRAEQRDVQRNLRAEESVFASQTSTQLNAEFRVMEHVAKRTSSTESRLQDFANQAEETIDAQRHLFTGSWKKSEDMKTRQVLWSISSRAIASTCRSTGPEGELIEMTHDNVIAS